MKNIAEVTNKSWPILRAKIKGWPFLFFTIVFFISLWGSIAQAACSGDGDATDLSCGLIGWWQFNDGTGLTALDSSTGGNNGTLVNDPVWVSGIVGPNITPYAVSLNGTNQAVTTGLTQTGITTFSVSAWIKSTSTAANYVVSWGTNIALLSYPSDGNEVAFTVNGSSWAGASASAGTKLMDGRWHHLVGTYDGTNQYLYIDNVLVAGPTAGTFTAQPTQLFNIGKSGSSYLNGSVEDVRVYNRALSQTEVTSLFDLGVIKPSTYYVDYADGSDNNNGTSTSTPWQHVPGDTNATGYPALTALNPGDTVIFKGGVSYLGTVNVKWGGTGVTMTAAGTNYQVGDVLNVSQQGGGTGMTITVSTVNSSTGAITSYTQTSAGSGYMSDLSCTTSGGSGSGASFNYNPLPITYDGNSAGTFGTGKAIIDGQGDTLGVNARQYGFVGLAINTSPTNIGQSFITINNFEIRNLRYVFEDAPNSGPNGIYFTGLATNVEIKNCYLHDIQKTALALNTQMNRINSQTAGDTNGHLAIPLPTTSMTVGTTSVPGTLTDTAFDFTPYVSIANCTTTTPVGSPPCGAVYKINLGWSGDDYDTAWGYTGGLNGNKNSVNIYQDINLTKPGWNTAGYFYYPLRPVSVNGTTATSVGNVIKNGLVSSVLTDSSASFSSVVSVQIYSAGANYQVNDILNIVQSGASGATVTVTAINPVASITLNSGGTGYKVGDVLNIVQAGGSNATATVTEVNCSGTNCSGPITRVSLTTTGNGYMSASNVSTSGGFGQNATLNITVVTGQIVAVTLTAAGTGYSSAEGLSTSYASGSNAGSGAKINIKSQVYPADGEDFLRITSGTGVTPGDYLVTANTGTTLTVLGNFGTSTAGNINYSIVRDYFYWIYNMNSGSHMANGWGDGIVVNGDNNVLIHDNIVQEAKVGISIGPENEVPMDNTQIYNNDISMVGWGISAVSGGYQGQNLTNLKIFGNTIHDFWNHDLYDWGWHNDGVFLFNAGGDYLTQINGVEFYNNLFYGNIAFATADLYIEGNVANMGIYNNIFASQGSGYDIRTGSGPGIVTGISVLNNTFAKTPGSPQSSMLFRGTTYTILRNNIIDLFEGYGGDFGLDAASTQGSSSDYNLLNNAEEYSGDVDFGGTIYNLAQWQTANLSSAHDQDSIIHENALFKNFPAFAAMSSAEGCSTTGGASGCATPGTLSRVYLLADANMPAGSNYIFDDGIKNTQYTANGVSYTFENGDYVEYNFDGVPRTVHDTGTDSTGNYIDITPALLTSSQKGDTVFDWKGISNFYYDLSLNTGSPGINAGTNLSATIGNLDANGVTRSQWDIGAYAFGTAGTISPNVVLTVNQLNGATGTGTVTSSLFGINCGKECSAAFATGTQVTLTATPASGSVFAGWLGGGCSGTGNCVITMNAAHNVTAYFTTSSNASLYGDVIGTGHVTIYDAELTAQYAIGLTVHGFIRANAQVDGNNTVDIYDAYLIAEYAIGLITKFAAVQP